MGQEGLRQLFAEQGFHCESMTTIERDVENRLRGLTMKRRWIQATFILKHQASRQGSPACLAALSGHATASGNTEDQRPACHPAAASSRPMH